MLATAQSKNSLILGLTIIGICVMLFIKPIAQNPNYHQFADQRAILSIEHFWNVASNIPFFVFGLLGMFFMMNKSNNTTLPINSFVFYLGICLTSVGSMYYHHHPCNQTLVWDRLPMAISFMAFFSIIIGDCICLATGKKILLPLILLGLISIIHWQMTKEKGQEDLRFYVLIQFLPIILIPVILLLYNNQNQNIKTYWYILAIYVVAKICEASDEFIFASFKIISGHSLKHLIASLAPVVLVMSQTKLKTKIISRCRNKE